MTLDAATIEGIVRTVMRQLQDNVAAPSAPAPSTAAPQSTPEASSLGRLRLTEKVITAALLDERVGRHKQIALIERAIITPSAREWLRARGVDWTSEAITKADGAVARPRWRIILSAASETVVRAVDDTKRNQSSIASELAGLPDEALARGLSALLRGEETGVVLVARDAVRLACQANRHASIRAAAVRTVEDVTAAQEQLAPNLLCLEPANKSFFELRTVLRRIVSGSGSAGPSN